MSEVTKSDYTSDGKYKRKIRSFVLREGRLTTGQERALEQFWPEYGVEFTGEHLDLDALFGRVAPRVLEIGFGMGASFVEMAKNAPEKDFLGIEVHRPGIAASILSAREQQVTNLKLLCHDAVEVLQEMLPEQSLDTVQLFFPDPWHKKRHHKRRIVQPDFVQMLHKVLKVGGAFHMATDWQEYAEHMLAVMHGDENFINSSDTHDYVDRPSWRPLTKFEHRGQLRGHGVWDLIFIRR